MPALGRLHAPDPRDADYPLRALIAPARAARSRFWRTGSVLNQGNFPYCVGYAWRNWMDSSPLADPLSEGPSADELYRLAQQNDEWPGEAYEGTSVRGGAKAMQLNGRLGAYHWSQDLTDVRDYLLNNGPVVFGTNWSESMFDPDRSEFVRYDPAHIAGGHAYLVTGWSESQGAVRGFQSWGLDWGQRGRFWIAGEDVDRLLKDDGEACSAAKIEV